MICWRTIDVLQLHVERNYLDSLSYTGTYIFHRYYCCYVWYFALMPLNSSGLLSLGFDVYFIISKLSVLLISLQLYFHRIIDRSLMTLSQKYLDVAFSGFTLLKLFVKFLINFCLIVFHFFKFVFEEPSSNPACYCNNIVIQKISTR